MAEVNINELRKAAEKKKAAEMNIVVIRIGGKDYFRGKIVDQVYESYDECVNENQRASRIAILKSQGKDENGRTPEQIEIAKEVAELMKKKNRILEQARDIDIEISELRRVGRTPDDEDEEKKPTRRSRKK